MKQSSIQSPLFAGFTRAKPDLTSHEFSHGGFCPQQERLNLEIQFKDLLSETPDFNRQQVSFQANKKALIHNWIKYKEGFSAKLVEKFIDEFNVKKGHTILEPFSGSGTTLLVAKMRGINAVGFELLPNCQLIWEAKKHTFNYSLDELQWIRTMMKSTAVKKSIRAFPHIEITKGAFPRQTENEIMFYSDFIETLLIAEEAKVLMKLILARGLADVSYTRKDGQYLRWDARSPKFNKRNEARITKGMAPLSGMDKGEIQDFKSAFLSRFDEIFRDIKILQDEQMVRSRQTLISKSVLFGLPELENDTFDAVITSPPYCNRYDYTRSYALELAYLGLDDEDVKQLRQELLSCTVENKIKVDKLREYYLSLGKTKRFSKIIKVLETDPVLNEINEALQKRWSNGDINNKGILRMVKGYFIDLGFVIAEMYRTCKKGAHVAIVNDNVRYGGEIIPVDLVSTSLASKFGFQPVSVYVLPQRKGNSSQQMRKFGRQALRKSITIWRK